MENKRAGLTAVTMELDTVKRITSLLHLSLYRWIRSILSGYVGTHQLYRITTCVVPVVVKPQNFHAREAIVIQKCAKSSTNLSHYIYWHLARWITVILVLRLVLRNIIWRYARYGVEVLPG